MTNKIFSRRNLSRTVIALWLITFVIITIRVGIAKQHSVYEYYKAGASRWLEGKPLYEGDAHMPSGFVYSPLAAAFFAPLALLPDAAAEALWRVIALGVCMLGLRRWLATAGRRFLEPVQAAWFYLFLLPLCIGNLNNGQANLPLAGLLAWAAATACAGEWTWAALCIAVATYLKVYPLAAGLLLCVMHPRKMTWRLALWIAGLGLLSLVLQHPSYVVEQYREWIVTRLSDNRHLFAGESTPHDLFMLLGVLHLHTGEFAYHLLQAGSGCMLAVACLRGRLMGWREDFLLNQWLGMSCAWLLLCGPASESATYVLMAAPLLLELMHCFSKPAAVWRRVWIVAAFAPYAGSFTIRSLFPLRDPRWMATQPASALIFLCYAAVLMWLGEGTASSSPAGTDTAARETASAA